ADDDAEARGSAGDPAQFQRFGELGYRPGGGAAGRVGRGEDLAAADRGDAEARGRAGDSIYMEVGTFGTEIGDAPRTRRPSRVGGGVDEPFEGDGDAELGGGTGDAPDLALVRASLGNSAGAGVDRVPARRGPGRIGRGGDRVVAADRDAELGAGAGDAEHRRP